MSPAFLPVNQTDLDERGWDCCDFIFVSADAYVDHPSFAAALIGRVLEDAGYRVGIIPQPDWKNPASYGVLGRPRLAFLAGAGNMDSMVAHYTAARKPRSEDAYSPGGKSGFRPDRALLKYVEGIRSVFSDVAVIIGGIEASLRRFAHYDYWSDKVRRSILLDSKADILVYGMGERPLLEIARRLAAGEPAENVPGTCVRSSRPPEECIRLPDYEAVRGKDAASLRLYAEHFMIQKLNADPATAKPLAELSDGGRWVIQNPPAFPLTQAELDHVYELPFLRRAHPMYDAAGGIPAAKETAFSLVSSRGCFGGCSFCAITFHQGRAVTGRSRESLLREAAALTELADFKGYIHDAGGPTANFYTPPCERQKQGSFCPEKECLWPEICPRLRADHGPYLALLDALSGNSQKIKKVFIRSGIRYDYINHDKSCGRKFLETLCRRHVSGQLKVAPEHITPKVLAAMGKNSGGAYEQFRKDFADINQRLGLKQYLIPYFISGHPGSTLEDAADLARYVKQTGFVPDQVQDFYPTPGTLSTVMHHTGLDPRTMEPIYTAKGEHEKKLQKALLHFNHPENKALVEEALKKTGRNHV